MNKSFHASFPEIIFVTFCEILIEYSITYIENNFFLKSNHLLLVGFWIMRTDIETFIAFWAAFTDLVVEILQAQWECKFTQSATWVCINIIVNSKVINALFYLWIIFFWEYGLFYETFDVFFLHQNNINWFSFPWVYMKLHFITILWS